MCGIVGLHLRNPELYPRLGELLTSMLCEMEERGADSAGVAVYGDPTWSPPGTVTVSVLEADQTAEDLISAVSEHLGTRVSVKQAGATQLVSAPIDVELLKQAILDVAPGCLIAGFGQDLAVLKGVGHPRDLAAEFGLRGAQGWQGVGHTRMATESAVTPGGCHPYAVGDGQCLVHNGSFSNHATLRRELQRKGVQFDSQNDTEVGARFIAEQMRQGSTVEAAVHSLSEEFDGFYTLLVSNRDSFAVVRDAIACKPAVIAETDGWVAMASEYRALTDLPGIDSARLYEPEPNKIYAWSRKEVSPA
ncbi:glutamine amidotransferase [Nesterenkonia aurantiaca]|uniref:glutamine--fructose-6-phosphate transaminase (isomerizing) n=1 Tax=Nesterenkonia aurantiaca TaxID=1436010 RepID=A0A4R7G8A9_9MICC|nr:glutamine amidotransferase [Nesterenkonia aurantiaca]TDS87768.1 N-methylglutamate synthase subunit A [Nesterenkonia aurantiaca]